MLAANAAGECVQPLIAASTSLWMQVPTGECRSKRAQLSRLLRGPKGHLDGDAAQIARDSKVKGKFKPHPPPDIVPFRRSLPDLLHSTDGYVCPSLSIDAGLHGAYTHSHATSRATVVDPSPLVRCSL